MLTRKKIINTILLGDCCKILKEIPNDTFSACITDPPYNYEFIGRKWDDKEIKRRLERINKKNNKTVVKNIPYGSGLAGGVRNKRWYERNRENDLNYIAWVKEWGRELFRVMKPGATIAVFNSNRTVGNIQSAFQDIGFYSRDILVYRRSTGIPKGANLSKQLSKTSKKLSKEWEGWHSCLRNEWEGIAILQKPLENNYSNTFQKYQTGVFKTNINSEKFQSNILENFKFSNNDKVNVHCTVKPLSLMTYLVKMLVPPSPDTLLLDPFAGVGSTLIGAKKNNINYVGIEIEPEYIKVAKNRIKKIFLQRSFLDDF